MAKTTTAKPKSEGVLALEKLRKGLDHFRDVCFPGQPEFELSLVPLSVAELQVAQAEAERRFRDIGLGLNVLNSDDFASELHIQVLARSMRSKGDRTVRLFSDADELREMLTADERTHLTSDYIDLQSEANPTPEEMSDELFVEIEEAIKKKDQSRLNSIGSNMLATYLLSMASRSPT